MPLLLPLLIVHSMFAQQNKLDMRNTHHRLLAVVPMVGTGPAADPRRPDYVPVPRAGEIPGSNAILAFSYQLSDDRKYALVEFVARDRSAFAPILSSGIKGFEKGKAKKDEIEKEFRKYKKDVNLDSFGVMVP